MEGVRLLGAGLDEMAIFASLLSTCEDLHARAGREGEEGRKEIETVEAFAREALDLLGESVALGGPPRPASLPRDEIPVQHPRPAPDRGRVQGAVQGGAAHLRGHAAGPDGPLRARWRAHLLSKRPAAQWLQSRASPPLLSNRTWMRLISRRRSSPRRNGANGPFSTFAPGAAHDRCQPFSDIRA